MATTFKDARRLQGERVRMQFDDGREVVALLLCATKDIDGAKHLIYDKVESGALAESRGDGATGCFYADAKTLVRIDHADAREGAPGPRGRDRFSMRHGAESEAPRAWRPSA
jgi:hypothetical protein